VVQPISDDSGSFLDPAQPPGGTYYENPAPGDDGSYDCPPGGAPYTLPRAIRRTSTAMETASAASSRACSADRGYFSDGSPCGAGSRSAQVEQGARPA
jgi:hypothetical protein